jgi:hypothetical protein
MSNQFTKAQEQGLEPGDEAYPEGTNQFIKGTREEHPEDVRKRIKVSNILSALERIIDSEASEDSSIIAASRVMLDKALPSLSAVEQTNHDGDANNPEQVEAKLRMLISKADPALLSRILGERARSLAQRSADTDRPEVGNASQ